MPKFVVWMRLPVTQFQSVTVEAENESKAEAEAMEQAKNGWLDGDWIDDPDSCGEPYVGHVEVMDENDSKVEADDDQAEAPSALSSSLYSYKNQ